MSEEITAANPADEQTAAPVADEAPTQEANTQAEGTDEQAGEPDLSDLLEQATGAAEATPEAVEVEYEGKKYSIPAELKDALLRQSDYTKKTMSLAEEKRAIEETKTKVEEIFTASREAVECSFRAEAAEAKVKELLNTPIDGLSQEQINALRLDLADAQSAAAQYKNRAAELASKASEERSQHVAKAVTEARTEAARHIPNFDDAKIAAYGSLVESLGGEPEALKQVDNAATWRVLHLAHIGQQFIERQRQAGRAKAAQEVQPAAEVGGQKAAPTKRDLVKDADKMSTDEWLKQRNAQLKGK